MPPYRQMECSSSQSVTSRLVSSLKDVFQARKDQVAGRSPVIASTRFRQNGSCLRKCPSTRLQTSVPKDTSQRLGRPRVVFVLLAQSAATSPSLTLIT